MVYLIGKRPQDVAEDLRQIGVLIEQARKQQAAAEGREDDAFGNLATAVERLRRVIADHLGDGLPTMD